MPYPLNLDKATGSIVLYAFLKGIGVGMKIRIGFGLGTRSSATDPRPSVAILKKNLALIRFGFQSVCQEQLDPLVAMSWIAVRTEKLKFGPSVMVLLDASVLLAKSFASLDRFSNGRVPSLD